LDSGITSTPDILARAASAAENGAKHTEGVIAKMDRGSYLGERSRGSIDPGAMFISIFLQALRKPE
jgi:dihydroxyacetone kinase